MTHQPISLHEIDFSQPDGEFIYKGQTYQIKQYANNYFFRNKKHTGCDFICLLWYAHLKYYYPDVAKYLCQQNSSPPDITQTIQEKEYYIQRCVQYKKALFTFGVSQRGYYYSPKDNEWISLDYLNCQASNRMCLDEILENPYELFVEQAKIAYENEIPLIENDDLFYSFIRNTTKPIEFICGSESKLTRLTKIAVFTLPEIKHIFEHYSSLRVIYKSENNYRHGGVEEISAGDLLTGIIICRNEVIYYGDDGNLKDTLSKQAQKLFDLLFEYNFFTGLKRWDYNGRDGYGGYYPRRHTIEIDVEIPSQHERLEAARELQSWLEGKLPDDEIRSYFEG